MSAVFTTTFNYWENGRLICQPDARVTVDADGRITIELVDLATGEWFEPGPGPMETAALVWVNNEDRAKLDEALDEARRGKMVYDREVARGEK